jgi:YHS domain-containing protein
MNVLARFARFLIWVLVLSWSMWLLRRVFGWLLRKAENHSQQHVASFSTTDATKASRRLVRDPVCGMHVDETLSIPYRDEGELLHFCSIACRDAYLSSTKKFVANA